MHKNFHYYTQQEVDDLILATMTKYTWMPAGAVRAPTLKPAAYVDHGISGAWEFTDGAEEIIHANLRLPDLADRGESFSICLGWSSPAMTLLCDWEVAYLLTKVNEDTSGAAQQTLQAFKTSSGTANGLVVSPFEVVAGQIHADDVCIHVQIMRDGNDGGDTLGDDAHLHGIALGCTAYRY